MSHTYAQLEAVFKCLHDMRANSNDIEKEIADFYYDEGFHRRKYLIGEIGKHYKNPQLMKVILIELYPYVQDSKNKRTQLFHKIKTIVQERI